MLGLLQNITSRRNPDLAHCRSRVTTEGEAPTGLAVLTTASRIETCLADSNYNRVPG